jgi:hypothetical protein
MYRSYDEDALAVKQAIPVVFVRWARRGGRTGGPWLLRAGLWLLHGVSRLVFDRLGR